MIERTENMHILFIMKYFDDYKNRLTIWNKNYDRIQNKRSLTILMEKLNCVIENLV